MKLSDLVASPDTGRLSESRVWGHLGKLAILYLVLAYPDAVLAGWEVAFVLFGFLVAPEIVKRWIGARSGDQSR